MMILPVRPDWPKIVHMPTVRDAAGLAAGLERDLRAAVRGEVGFDAGTRAVYATDSSNYRQIPVGVVFPASAADVAAALRVCAEHDVPDRKSVV